MNIFVTNKNPIIAAQNLDDRHIFSNLASASHILSNALFMNGFNKDTRLSDKILKPVQVEHPWSEWGRETRANYCWLLEFTYECLKIVKNNTLRDSDYAKFYDIFVQNDHLICDGPLLDNFVNMAVDTYHNVDYRDTKDTILAYILMMGQKWKYYKPTWNGRPKPVFRG